MSDEYIRKEEAIDAATQDSTENRTHSFRAGQARSASRIKALEPADVVSKADMITLLEETEKEIAKGVEESPTGMMIKSVFGVIKCKVNMLGENHG